MQSASCVDDLSCLSPIEKTAHIVEKLFRLSRIDSFAVGVEALSLAAFVSEKIHLVTRPAAREIHSQSAVSLRTVCRNHHKLVAGKNLWNTPHCRHQSHREPEFLRVLPDHIPDSVRVVVAGKNQQIIHIGIEKIVRKNLVYPRHSAAPTCTLIQSHTQGVVKRKIHH